MMSLQELTLRIHAVSGMRDLLEEPVIKALIQFLDLREDAAIHVKMDAYTHFVHTLYATGTENLSRYVQKIVFESENIYVRTKGRGKAPSAVLEKSLREDLKVFHEIALLTPEILAEKMGTYDFLPGWTTETADIEAEYLARVKSIAKYGYGIYAKYKMFYIDKAGVITPVQNPDSTRLADLIDYKREQAVIMDNTRALLCGKPAANIL